ncbi:RNA polymerase II mediator complex subunit [Myotisia sp. PD_48]|nr:RNA polymerase II mediator complex subunit [Myotisia sp. PD_48]
MNSHQYMNSQAFGSYPGTISDIPLGASNFGHGHSIDSNMESPVIDLSRYEEEGEEPLDFDRPSKRPKLDTPFVQSPLPQFEAGEHIDPVSVYSTHRHSMVDEVYPSDGEKAPWSFCFPLGGQGTGYFAPSSALNAAEMQPSITTPPLPMPARPQRSCPPRSSPTMMPEPADLTELMTVPAIPYTNDAPATAPKTGDGGSHQEDIMNDQAIMQGFYDCVHVSQNESNSARQPLRPYLSQQPGLELLSNAFSAVLEQRQANSRIMQPSTFKPPPRVTITDPRREAWLRELANHEVPLRKLSRTIPHGVRGRVLLEQCLNKNIPLARAIWLVKCVGANEIRAFKRKGTAAAVANNLEAKWIRDWTISIQQFLEVTIQNPEDDPLERNKSYAAAGGEDGSLKFFWEKLTRYRPLYLTIYYRTASTNLMDKQAQNSNAGDILKPLIESLQSLVRSFTLSCPSSFVIPLSWPKCQNTLRPCFDSSPSTETAILAQLCERNERLIVPNNEPYGSPRPRRSASQMLMNTLDSMWYINNFFETSSKCLEFDMSHNALVSHILVWASSPLRHGKFRVFVAIRLLRRWAREGVDLDKAFIAFFSNKSLLLASLKLPKIYQIMAELVRSQSITVGKFFEWLLARGGIDRRDSPNNIPLLPEVDFILHIPSRRLPDHVNNLRNILMKKIGVTPNAELAQICQMKFALQMRYPQIFLDKAASPSPRTTAALDYSKMAWAVRSELAQWLRDQVLIRLRAGPEHRRRHRKRKVPPPQPVYCELSLTEYLEMRDIFERIGDISMMADVLDVMPYSTNPRVLASTIDTINYNFETLTAIGATKPLFKAIADAYLTMPRNEPGIQDLIISLLDVAVHFPEEVTTIAVLRRDLVRYENKSTLSACSPVSEHAADVLNPTNPAFRVMLDQLLASGNIMDDTTMIRVFDLLIQKLENGESDIRLSPNEVAKYLAELRLFNHKMFDALMIKRVLRMLDPSHRKNLPGFLPPLVGVGCITFPSFFALVEASLDPTTQSNPALDGPNVRFDALRLLSTDQYETQEIPDAVSYRFKIALRDYLNNNCDDIISYIYAAMAEAYLKKADATSQELLKATLFPLLCDVVVRRSSGPQRGECLLKLFQKFPDGVQLLERVLDRLLGLESRRDPRYPVQEIFRILERINEVSVVFSVIKLRLFINSLDDDSKIAIVEPLFAAFEHDALSGSFRWIDIIPTLNTEIRKRMRQMAENKLLASLVLSPAVPELLLEDPYVDENSCISGLVYLSIIEELAPRTPFESASATSGNTLVEKMNILMQRAISLSIKLKKNVANSAATSGDRAPPTDASALGVWCYIILRFISIQRSTFTMDRGSKADLTDQTRLLITVCYIAFTPMIDILFSKSRDFTTTLPTQYSHLRRSLPDTWPSLRTYATDVAALLTDTIPNDARRQCARFLQDKCPFFLHPYLDPRLTYLFSPLPETQNLTAAFFQNPSNLSSLPPKSSPAPPNQQPPPLFNTTAVTNNFNSPLQNLRFQQAGRIIGPPPPRPWEMLQDPAPIAGVNDTALNLAYFGTRLTRAE